MPHSTEAALVFTDLQDAFTALEVARGSPKNVRRAFSLFIALTQKLTAAMRRDYSRLNNGSWQASSFAEWTPVTDLVKYLRNEDQHSDQVFISVHERRFFPIPTDLPLPVAVEPGKLFVFEGTWHLTDQLLDAPPEGITTYSFDPKTGQPTQQEIAPVKIERQYILQARSDEARSKIQEAGLADVHDLAVAAFLTLSKYFQFFCEQTGT